VVDRPVMLVVAGAAGRMGREVLAAALADPAFRVVGALEAPGHAAIGRSLRELGLGDDTRVRAELDEVPGLGSGARAVLIEFCLGPGAVRHARRAAEAGLAVVSGSTALSEAEEAEIKGLAARVPVFRSRNFSRGAAATARATALLARTLGAAYDAEIVEAHHRGKRDVPSGTALTLAEAVREARGGGELLTGRRAADGPRAPGEIGLHGLRAGEIAGEHRVLFAGPGETVELVHRASGRSAFAAGALRAARFVADRQAGLYGMSDLLEEKA
jgi:4-hydroxy-tetrahydrodipicolinate reductase